MTRPAWLKRGNTAPRKERDAAAMAHTSNVLALVDARLASHGFSGLPAWLRANVSGMGATDRACVMQRVMGAHPPGDVLSACRAVMS